MTDWVGVLQQIQDALIPKLQLDPWERAIYHYLLRHSRLLAKPEAVLSLDAIAAGTGFSTTKVRDSIRSMNSKGCLAIDARSRQGHAIRVLLPSEIEGLIQETTPAPTEIEGLDFYTGRKYLASLLAREEGRCFYCMCDVGESHCVLDHVISQVRGGDNSFKNIVVACHECNSAKQGAEPDDFLRSLYRANVLSRTELESRLGVLKLLQEGSLRPKV